MLVRDDATETAVIVPIPGVEAAVAEHRRRLDVAAGWGVPAHVSVLYPFVHPTAVDEALLDRLGAALGAVAAFECTFARCGWFGEDVLWLAPEPDRPFRELTSAVWGAFPEHPPYRGVFDDVVPHLTVGEARRGSLAELRAAESAVRPRLPIDTIVDHAVLIAGTARADSWHTVRTFRLESRTE